MKKILLVDDDLDMLQLYQMALETEGFQVVTASGGKEAVAKAPTEKPDLILLDVMMPEMNGIEVLDALKENVDTMEIPVAIFTNFSDENYMKEALDKGALKFLIKSDYEPQELIKEINSLLEPPSQEN